MLRDSLDKTSSMKANKEFKKKASQVTAFSQLAQDQYYNSAVG